MDETPREKWATWIALFSTIIPGMIVSGFMPAWNVLPVEGWVGVAASGSAIAGAIATPLTLRGAISGVIGGVGMMAGLWLYVLARSAITGSNTYIDVELAIGGMLGATPGVLLYMKWARRTAHEEDVLPWRDE